MKNLRENIFTDKAELELKLALEISQILKQEIKIKVITCLFSWEQS